MGRAGSTDKEGKGRRKTAQGTVLVAFQREVRVQPGTRNSPRPDLEPLAVAIPRALYRELGRIVVGDEIEYEPGGHGGKPSIVQLLPRRSEFYRTTADGRSQLLFSNVDRLVICASPDQPPFRPGLVDRLLVAAEAQEVEPLLLMNKADLVEPEQAQTLLAPYRQMGYECILASVLTGQGLDELMEHLKGHCGALVGHSGVGKSSLINRIVPAARLPVGNVAEATGKGQHTTTRASLLVLPNGGFLLDSPGIRMFGLLELEPLEVARLFPDFRELPPCRFSNCMHLLEDGCSARQAVEKQEIAAERYLSYQRIVHSLDPRLPVADEILTEPVEIFEEPDEDLLGA